MAEAKLALPKQKFSHELVPAPTEAAMKAAEATSAKLYRVPVDKIRPIPGFNVRVKSQDYLDHVATLKQSIGANGYDTTKPLAGYVAKEGDENVIYVTDGHSRLDAVTEINEEADGKTPIPVLPVLVQPKEASLFDLTVALHTANSGRPLTPFELGVVVKRLMSEDADRKKSDIAKRLTITTRYLDDVLLLANADKAVKQHVASGAVSSTLAIGLLRKDADTAAEKIETAVAKTAGTGKKATKKHTAAPTQKVTRTVAFEALDDMKELVKAVAAEVRGVVPAEEGDDDAKLSSVTGVVTLVIEIPAEEKPEPKKKAPAPKAKKPVAKKAKAEPAEEPDEAPAPKAKKPAAKKAKAEPVEEPVKVKVKKAPAKKAKAKKSDLGIEGAEEIDGEMAILPPKVTSEEDEVDI